MKNKLIVLLLCVIFIQCTGIKSPDKNKKEFDVASNQLTVPSLLVNDSSVHDISKAYRIAIGDIVGNIQHHKSGVLGKKELTLYAGLAYDKPWTRDAAINVWNGFGMLSPEVSKNTLLAQVTKNDFGEDEITGQYWDKIIWTIGAWNYYLCTGDSLFLEYTYTVVKNTLLVLERDEFTKELGLFRGPAVYGDGVSAYPKIYTNHQDIDKNGSYSGIYNWAKVNDDLKNEVGYGMPMHALSTNAVYYQAYVLLSEIEKELQVDVNPVWKEKARELSKAINTNFWSDTKKNYTYLVDPFGNSDAQESLGISLCLLFGIATEAQVASVFENTVVEPAGIPCVYPSFDRFKNEKLDSYGRHSGTVWPHIQGFWADASMKYNNPAIFMHEFNALTRHAIRDFQFVEIYHPTKETAYGGLQEPNKLKEWFCAERQTWSATAYLRMIYKNIIGVQVSVDGVYFKPFLPYNVQHIELLGMKYKNAILDIDIAGEGTVIEHFSINGKEQKTFFLPGNSVGNIKIQIKLKK